MDPSVATYSRASFTQPGQAAAAVPLGTRGATAIGSGLRSGAILVESVDRVAAELQTAREAAAVAARDAALAEQRAQEAESRAARAEGAEDTGPERAPVNTSRFGLSEGDTERSINAAREAAFQGERTPRGAFVNLSV